MFSDVISDSIMQIEKYLNEDYAHQSIYPPEYVIKMLESMYLCIYLSDARMPDGTFVNNYTLSQLKEMARNKANEVYLSKMN
jgi:hypothetical protein